MEHVHPARERELAGPLRNDGDLGAGKRGKAPADVELRQDDLVAAGAVLPAVEGDPERNALLATTTSGP